MNGLITTITAEASLQKLLIGSVSRLKFTVEQPHTPRTKRHRPPGNGEVLVHPVNCCSDKSGRQKKITYRKSRSLRGLKIPCRKHNQAHDAATVPTGLPAPDLCYFSPCLTQAPCVGEGLESRGRIPANSTEMVKHEQI